MADGRVESLESRVAYLEALVGQLAGGGGGGVTSVTGGSGVASSGGATPNITLATIADQRLLANISGGVAVPSANSWTAIIDAIVSNTQGATLTRNAGTWTAISPGAVGLPLLSGGAGANLSYAQLGTAGIAALAVTYAKIQNVSANAVLLGSAAAGAGAPPSEIVLGTNLSMTGSTLNAASGGITGFTSALNTGAPNNTINNSSLTASGGSASQGVTIAWKGNGGYRNVTIPDGTATGGNVPGARSIDDQIQRAAAGQVAAMDNSFQAATSNSTMVGGGGGYSANIAGTTLSTQGARSLNTGLANVSTGDNVFNHGAYGNDRGVSCEVFGANYGTAGGIQTRTFELWTQSAFSAAVRTLNNGSGQNAILPNTSIGVIPGVYVGMFGGTDYAVWKFEGIAYRAGTAASTLINTVATAIAGTLVSSSAGVGALGWTCDMIADTTNGGPIFRTKADAGQIVSSRLFFPFGELDP